MSNKDDADEPLSFLAAAAEEEARKEPHRLGDRIALRTAIKKRVNRIEIDRTAGAA
jgi:hypothetical protein